MSRKKITAVILAMVTALLPAAQLYAKSEYKGTIVDGKKQGYGTEYNEDGSWTDGY